MLETRVGSAWLKNAAALASLFHHASGVAGGHPGACNPSDVSACGILALQDYVW